MPTQAELLVIEAERLKDLEQLLTDIEQSNQIELDHTFQVYAPLPDGVCIQRELKETEAPNFKKQASVIKKILQHP